jgi:hypothetical protein
MGDVSIEMLTTVVLDMDRRFSQRLQTMDNLLAANGKQIEKLLKQVEDMAPRFEQITKAIGEPRDEVPKETIDLKNLDDLGVLRSIQGQILSALMTAKTQIADLGEVEFNVTSPANEDGIIDWLVGRLRISPRRFVEIGAGDFKHGICRFLAAQRGWKGLLLDPDGAALYYARQDDFYRLHNLNAFEASITRESINEVLAVNEMSGPLGLLSLNAGGIEYWVWSGLTITRPDIVVCAFNPVFGDRYAITVPYNPNFAPLEMHPSNYYRGASIAALNLLAKEKNYVFVGTNTKGTNAFFVRGEIAGDVLPLIERPRAFPARARNPEDKHEELESVGGISRLGLIKDLPVVDLASGKTLKLSELDQPYSEDWQRGMN